MAAIPRSALTAPALLLLALTPATAAAATCAERPVAARGDPSRFEVLAKANARGNWRAKVRSIPALGAAYANFSRALAADYRCTERAGQHTCEAFGHPCKE